MRKASAITLSIFIMMIVLAVLLGYTAYYVDQVIIRPVVLMQDAEISLRCFFILSNIQGGDYLREGETVFPQGSLRHDLIKTYQISAIPPDPKVYDEVYEESLALMYGTAERITMNEKVFWQAVRRVPVTCYFNLYGPERRGVVGLFVQQEVIDEVKYQRSFWQNRIYGEGS